MNSVEYVLNDDELVLKIFGRVDSTNSVQLEQNINAILEEIKYSSLVVDVEELEYISSAGLRVILRLRKNDSSLKIINAKPEVYEIFDMTGFVEMMPIEKAYRRISIDGCQVIGQGANGIVYRIDPDTIVKYYFKKDALESIHRERELARKAFIMGIPTAIPYDVVKVNDGFGSVFELLNADPFVNLIIKNPDKIDDYIAEEVDVLKKFHSTDVNPDDVPSKREIGIIWAKQAGEYLPEETAKKLLKLFENIDDSNKLMHGDFHIKNVMMQNGEVLLIDMDTLCRGNAVYEFAGMFNTYIAYSELDNNNSMEFFGVPFDTTKYLFNKTLEMYLGTQDKAVLEDYYKKSAVVGYTEMVKSFAKKEPDSQATKYYISQLVELVGEMDSISF